MMPIYTFEDMETNEEVDLMFTSDEVPRIGDEITRDNRRLIRTVSCTIAGAQVARRAHGYPFVSHSLPKNCSPESQKKDGTPIVKSINHEKELLARTGYVRDCPGHMLDEVRAHEKKMKFKNRYRG